MPAGETPAVPAILLKQGAYLAKQLNAPIPAGETPAVPATFYTIHRLPRQTLLDK